jgi:hypothetical protein
MKTRAFVLPLWLLLLGCPGDDAGDTAAGSSTGMAATSTGMAVDSTTGAGSSTGMAATSTGMAVDSTTGAAPVDCSEITDQAACAAAELEPGLGACGWRSTSLVNPPSSGAAPGLWPPGFRLWAFGSGSPAFRLWPFAFRLARRSPMLGSMQS